MNKLNIAKHFLRKAGICKNTKSVILYTVCRQHKILAEEPVKSSSKFLRKSFLHLNHLHFAYSSLKLSCTCQAIGAGGEQSWQGTQAGPHCTPAQAERNPAQPAILGEPFREPAEHSYTSLVPQSQDTLKKKKTYP